MRSRREWCPLKTVETRVRIHQVNTGGLVEAVIWTPGGDVEYDGQFSIDGVPGTAAPILLNFMNVVGSRTGKISTGEKKESIDGVDVTIIDAAMPCMMMSAADVGKSGYETADEPDADALFLSVLKRCTEAFGHRMGSVM